MNKTFLLVASADYTEGSMLVVIDSIEEFVSLFKEYHARKMDALIDLPFYTQKEKRGPEWWKICDDYNQSKEQFALDHNKKPFDFEFNTGCQYIKHGRGEREFYDNVFILPVQDKDTNDGHWFIAKEFLSDLPRGTHYCGDYCA